MEFFCKFEPKYCLLTRVARANTNFFYTSPNYFTADKSCTVEKNIILLHIYWRFRTLCAILLFIRANKGMIRNDAVEEDRLIWSH